jgi:Xaa-Pro dipeptidase
VNSKELDLFKKHIETLRSKTDVIMEEQGIDKIIIGSGKLDYYFADDRSVFFKPTPHFAYWCPLEGPGHLLTLSRSNKPKLSFYGPDDFWHLTPNKDGKEWLENFDVVDFKKPEEKWTDLFVENEKVHFIGLDKDIPTDLIVNDDRLTKALDWNRSFKTEWEVHCIREANRLASRGHLKAKESFENGASEFDILMDYCVETSHASAELPYNAIIGHDEHAATLHYEQKRKDTKGTTLLIDAGATYYGYVSDITRTFLAPNRRASVYGGVITDRAHKVFSSLLNKLNSAQIRMVEDIKVGQSYVDIHRKSCLEIFEILKKEQIIIECPDEEKWKLAAVRPFFPHGLGHMLGIQVHDVAGKQVNMGGDLFDPNKEFPALRNYRKVEVGNVFTIEPGIYFIPDLLEELKAKHKEIKIDWDLVNELIPLGGIRIEDNVYLGENGVENLTRHYLP